MQGYNENFSHKLTAAADIWLMPSRFEPCGLNQMYAMRYGSVPVVHSTGTDSCLVPYGSVAVPSKLVKSSETFTHSDPPMMKSKCMHVCACGPLPSVPLAYFASTGGLPVGA